MSDTNPLAQDTNDDTNDGTADILPPETDHQDQTARIAELEAELAAANEKLLRAMAETENVRRRLEQAAEDRGKFAVNGFAKDVLPVADNLRRALESLPPDAKEKDELAAKLIEGVELTEKSFLAALERHGIKKVDSLGQVLNPHLHQAMMEIEDANHAAGTILLEMQAGYTLHGRLLREAMVGVAKGGPKPGAGASGIDTQA
jgi:molecular chaperone GrpE